MLRRIKFMFLLFFVNQTKKSNKRKFTTNANRKSALFAQATRQCWATCGSLRSWTTSRTLAHRCGWYWTICPAGFVGWCAHCGTDALTCATNNERGSFKSSDLPLPKEAFRLLQAGSFAYFSFKEKWEKTKEFKIQLYCACVTSVIKLFIVIHFCFTKPS